MLDPATCQSCHPTHVRDWSGSMHAYASDDPVFVAMNARGDVIVVWDQFDPTVSNGR